MPHILYSYETETLTIRAGTGHHNCSDSDLEKSGLGLLDPPQGDAISSVAACTMLRKFSGTTNKEEGVNYGLAHGRGTQPGR
ncbi:hypothetical protein VTH82DRAFT_7939 [Thermothelomyces myriococcoides]